jgi:predicted transposase/invertase (TIGR01784 family)
MILGIRPTVDFAFKKIFGSPQNSAALMGLLNAILNLRDPIAFVEILNPFSYQEFAESKLIVLDVRCKDSTGRYLNVEMQVSVYAGLVQRLMYYACSMHVDQLSKGGDYASLAPSISICLLSHVLYRGSPQPHHCFEMLDRQSGRKLENAIEVHTVELSKYNLSEETISEASKLQQWAFLLLRAQDYDALKLKRLLRGIEFETAIETIEIISEKTEDKQMYDQREKAQRDYEWALSGAREEGKRLGREEGEQLGLEKGEQLGLEKGEQLGLEKGKFAGRIQLLQELLGDAPSDDAELKALSSESLTSKLEVLQQRLRDRQ